MLLTATAQLETSIVAQAGQQLGRRLSSAEISTLVTHIIGERRRAGETTRVLPLLVRLAIKAAPYSPTVAALLAEHGALMRAWAATNLAGLLDTIEACRTLRVPVPVIVSCAPYLARARLAQAAVKARYFGIEPIVLRGQAETIEESLAGTVLCLPVDDSYEALPTKIFETIVLLDALGADCGILKLDDDLQVIGTMTCDAQSLQAIFAAADYVGTALDSPHHDRAWHFGKCLSTVPAIYAKPYRGPWARGAAYYVSGRAVRTLAGQYVRFPGCIAGEIYEDKAVGDVLGEAGIALVDHPLERWLGISTDAPERSLVAAA